MWPTQTVQVYSITARGQGQDPSRCTLWELKDGFKTQLPVDQRFRPVLDSFCCFKQWQPPVTTWNCHSTTSWNHPLLEWRQYLVTIMTKDQPPASCPYDPPLATQPWVSKTFPLFHEWCSLNATSHKQDVLTHMVLHKSSTGIAWSIYAWSITHRCDTCHAVR